MDFTTFTLTDVTRAFGRRRALNRVSLRAEAGELVAILGPNGSGKSTLLSIAATLLLPSTGEVWYGAHDGRRTDSSLRARIGLLGHDLYIYPDSRRPRTCGSSPGYTGSTVWNGVWTMR